MRTAVIGLGLIGGSLLRALAAGGHAVLGYDADPATRAVARTAAARAPQGERWQVAGAVRDAVANAELVVLAVPLPAVGTVLDELAGIGYSSLLTDVTSVKGPVRDRVNERARRFGRLPGFIGGHPMAGRETSGFTASDPRLFHGCTWVLCLEPGETELTDWLTLAALITTLGARVVPATAADHDRAVAAVSHVPHLLAAALATVAAADPLALSLGAGSFRDGTRVAASPPALSAAMTGGNADAVGPTLDRVLSLLGTARAALDGADPIGELMPWFATGTAARAGWPGEPSEPVALPADPDVLLRLGRAGGWVIAVADDRGTVTAARPLIR
ncbi:prephenate dehydrogenase/arogenate dehydrogenase family protein [Rugosimonospora africana]|uniref:Prephenate dehydrogenase n=1 Tax=Rugosimonospora africana TaxID=556532 RepID=A0A8J3QYS8_9ACTN|nr:prephenate dehydrogenase/arogenate dehydrogenase family protein [Rugosimonospora africana]GIH18260.1 prephenate dehydrogenase [Rugosimonospora africana]